MSVPRKHRLIETEWPRYGEPEAPAPVSASELEQRIEAVRERMAQRGWTHLAVYGDREHFANLAYLTNFDPRFEEALLIVKQQGTPLLLVGNECVGYAKISPLLNEGKLRLERYQPFSLLNQPRSESRTIDAILAEEGIAPGSTVGCAGWKDYAADDRLGRFAIDAPSYLVDTLRELAGYQSVENAAGLFIDPRDGLRTSCSVDEIAYFEYAAMLASDGVRRVIEALKPGMTDHELVAKAGYNGLPLATHLTLKAGNNRTSLASPIGARLERGGIFSISICYRGGHSCRAGWAATRAEELPEAARDYVDAFAGPYFAAMNEWFGLLRIGEPGGTLERLIQQRLPYDRFRVFLNAGHLLHLDEWVSAPMFAGSQVPLRSGMLVQADVIPSSPVYYSTRMEDGFVLADRDLQSQLRQRHPSVLERCLRRREWMRGVLGLNIHGDVLPLSNLAGMVPVFFLHPGTLLAMEPV